MTRPSRVLSVIDSLGAGGAERHLVNLCRGLRDGPFPSDVFALHGRGAVYADDLAASGIGLVVGGRSRRGLPVACARLRETLARGRYDIVHAYLPVSTVVATLIARWRRTPRVVTTVVARREQMPGGLFGFENYRRLERWIDLYLTPYPSQLADPGGIPAHKIRFAMLALDAARPAADDPAELPSWFAQIDGAFPVIAGVGRLHPDKGHDMAVRILAQLRLTHAGAKLVIMGTGAELDALRAFAQSCGVAEHVIFGGFMKNLDPLLRRAHVYVKTSVNEGANMAMMQAMGAGVPCVSFETGDMEYEGPDFRGCAIFVPLRDVDALASAVCSVVDDAELGRRITENAVRYVRARDPAAVVRATEQAYEDCLAAERT